MNRRKKADHNKASYFYSTLQRYLYEHFPELVDNKDLINSNVKSAQETYTELIHMGHDVYSAVEGAKKDLLYGLEFSKYDLIFDVVSEEFTEDIPEKEYRDFSISMISVCKDIFKKYPRTRQDSEQLRTELTGAISLHLDEVKVV